MPDIEIDDRRLPLTLKLSYAAPTMAGAAMILPIIVHMPRFYSDVIMVPLGYIAIAIAIARSFDAFTDPLMGWVADRFTTRWGRRKPWIALGVPFAAISFFALFSPPGSLTPMQAFGWFAITFAAYYLFHTVYVIPHEALGAELSLDYNERSSLFGIGAFFISAGTLIAAALPGIMDGLGMGDEKLVFRSMALGFAILAVLLYGNLLIRVPERPEFKTRESNPLVPGVRRAFRNRPFRIIFFSGMAINIAAGIPSMLMPYFVYYVIQPEHPAIWLTITLFAYLCSGLLSIPLWVRAAHRFGKLRTYIITGFVYVSGSLLWILLGVGDTVLMTVLMVYTGASSGGYGFLLSAMSADVIDYDELRTGKRREAQFVAFWSFIRKFAAIPGGSIPIAILSAIGYIPNQVQTPEVIFTLRFLFCIFPAAFWVAALIIIYRYPITEAKHLEIRERIAIHARGETVVDPLTGETLPPFADRPVEESTGWFLDYFSTGELRRMLRRGTGRALGAVLLIAGASLLLCVSLAWLAFNSVNSLTEEPGPLAVFAVVFSGLAFTLFLFQILRIKSAFQMVRAPVPKDTIELHLADVSRDSYAASNDGRWL